MKTRRGSSQETSSQDTSSGNEVPPSPVVTKDSIPAIPDNPPPRPVTPEQTEMAPPKTPSPMTKLTKNSSARRKFGSAPPSSSPEMMCTTSSLGSSPLSSPPSSLGSTPEGLVEPTTRLKRKADSTTPMGGRRATRNVATLTGILYGSLSTEQRTDLKRKAGADDDLEDDYLAARASKNAKSSIPEKSSLRKRGAKTLADTTKRNLKVRFASSTFPGHEESALTLLADTALSGPQGDTGLEARAVNGATTEPLSSSQDSSEQPASEGKPAPKGKPGRKPKPKRMTKSQLALETDITRHGEYIEATIFSHEDAKNPVFYGADGITQYVEPAGNSPAKTDKSGPDTGGGVKKRKGGGGWNKGLGKGKGKGKGKGRAKINRREDEEEDPFEGKDSTTDDYKNLVKLLKARQASLRSFFRDVGRQQADILDTLSLRDINRLNRRANAHKKVPEYDDVLEDLKEKNEDAIDLSNKRFELDKKLADTQYAREKELLEQQLRQRCQQVRAEHLSGAQGDLMLLQRQAAVIVDDDRTDDGSQNQDPAYFPRYHQFPESNVRDEPLPARGYTSSKINSERSFKVQLEVSNYDDQARRDVLKSDVMGPIIRSLEVSNQERREAAAREKTQNMMALSNEAVTKLAEEAKGYLLPTRLTGDQMSSYALSVLADVSEFHAEQNKEKTYRYLTLAPGDTFPGDAMDHRQLPGATRLPPPPQPRFPAASAHQRTHQFVFQNPGVPPTPARPAPASGPARAVQQRFPMQFVNQTIESRKAQAGNQGKGGQRLLLPKV